MTKWWQYLLGIGKGEIPDGAVLSFRFGSAHVGWVAFALAAAMLILTWLIYRREKAHAGVAYLLFLGTLRALAFGVVILSLLRPMVVAEKTEAGRAVVPVLVDDSRSMAFIDVYGGEQLGALERLVTDSAGTSSPPDVRKLTRSELLRHVLGSQQLRFWSRLSEVDRPRLFAFSEQIRPVDLGSPSAWPDPVGSATRLGDAIRSVAGALRGQRIAAMLVFSDGRSNAGQDPVGAAASMLSSVKTHSRSSQLA
jgi:hypothetical protein